MEFRTFVKCEPSACQLDYDNSILLVGSCFTENIGQKLKYFRFRTEINPCGIVYNPLSVANVLKMLEEGRRFTEKDLWENQGKWVSFYHHGSFAALGKEECLQGINIRLAQAAAFLKQTDYLLITFGTAWVYRHRATGIIVSNCHKFPGTDFERFRPSAEEIVQLYQPLLAGLRERNPRLKVIFTVSPIRHWKDGAHANQMSKAILLLATEALCRYVPQTYYFPAYEILMDELRDYRFYADDMLHPSSVAIEYIWEKFRDTWIAPRIYDLMRRIDKLNKSLAHRPLLAESA
ncbi:MAG: GSCFA domain-containing protein [Odoribacter laneus]|uniref:GSCFA domain-containing protein n=1 Tax=Odoribacter laneus TaxID=626933 RepID=UPI00399A96C0